MIRFFAGILVVASMLNVPAQSPAPGRPAFTDRWQPAGFFEHGTLPAPFSFKYNGKASADFLSTWEEKQTTRAIDANRTEQTFTFTESSSGSSASACNTTISQRWNGRSISRTPAAPTRR
jgi:hypothetical protein